MAMKMPMTRIIRIELSAPNAVLSAVVRRPTPPSNWPPICDMLPLGTSPVWRR